MNNAIGLLTPPVGTVLNVVCGVGRDADARRHQGRHGPSCCAQLVVLSLLVALPGHRHGAAEVPAALNPTHHGANTMDATRHPRRRRPARRSRRDARRSAPARPACACAAGGICGSDLHYCQHGGFGTIRIQQPMVLGHEFAGVIEEVGAGVAGLAVGDHVAVSPSRPCGVCRFCQLGLQNHCLDMRYFGSAMRMPHVQGAFRQQIVIEAGAGPPAGRRRDRRRRRDGRAAGRRAARRQPRRPAARQDRCWSPAAARSAR